MHGVVVAQLTPLRQEPSRLHLTLHAHPAGQTTLAVQLAVAQSIVHVPEATLHDEQLLGQGDASTDAVTTQTLSTHVRPPLQSLDVVQANSSLRRSIAHAGAMAIQRLKKAMNLTVYLRWSGRCQRRG